MHCRKTHIHSSLESKRDINLRAETNTFFLERRKKNVSTTPPKTALLSDYSLKRCEYSVSQLVDDTEEDDEKEADDLVAAAFTTTAAPYIQKDPKRDTPDKVFDLCARRGKKW